jgi:Protein of unknown function (DUF3318)
MPEIIRLQSLVPDRLRSIVKVERAANSKPKLLMTHRIKRDRYLIQVDLRQWLSIDIDLRNLLFWHELARIANGSIVCNRSTYIALIAGLSLSFIDLATTQNIGMLVSTLLVAGLAGFRIYQNQLGEQHLRQLTTADRDAIELAVEFGYDRDTARKLLKSALSQAQAEFVGDRSTRYAARLQVLSLVNEVELSRDFS